MAGNSSSRRLLSDLLGGLLSGLLGDLYIGFWGGRQGDFLAGLPNHFCEF